MALAKQLSFVERIETDEDAERPAVEIKDWQPSDDLKLTLNKALLQDKTTFLTREEINGRFQL